MSNYYLLSEKNNAKVESAFAPEGTKLAHELISELGNVKELPFILIVLRVMKFPEVGTRN